MFERNTLEAHWNSTGSVHNMEDEALCSDWARCKKSNLHFVWQILFFKFLVYLPIFVCSTLVYFGRCKVLYK